MPPSRVSQIKSESAGVPLAAVPSSDGDVEPQVLTVDRYGRASLADVFEVRASEIVAMLQQISSGICSTDK